MIIKSVCSLTTEGSGPPPPPPPGSDDAAVSSSCEAEPVDGVDEIIDIEGDGDNNIELPQEPPNHDVDEGPPGGHQSNDSGIIDLDSPNSDVKTEESVYVFGEPQEETGDAGDDFNYGFENDHTYVNVTGADTDTGATTNTTPVITNVSSLALADNSVVIPVERECAASASIEATSTTGDSEDAGNASFSLDNSRIARTSPSIQHDEEDEIQVVGFISGTPGTSSSAGAYPTTPLPLLLPKAEHVSKEDDKLPKNPPCTTIPSYACDLGDEKLDAEAKEQAEPAKRKETTPAPRPSAYPRRKCFNCLGDHMVNECPQPRNQQLINERRRQLNNGRTQERYHLRRDLEDRYKDYRPGVISKELQATMGLQPNQLPMHIYNMRKVGYPPGWLMFAIDSSSGMHIYSNSNSSGSSPDPVETLNKARLVDYPGLTSPVAHEYSGDGWSQNIAYNPEQSLANLANNWRDILLVQHQTYYQGRAASYPETEQVLRNPPPPPRPFSQYPPGYGGTQAASQFVPGFSREQRPTYPPGEWAPPSYYRGPPIAPPTTKSKDEEEDDTPDWLRSPPPTPPPAVQMHAPSTRQTVQSVPRAAQGCQMRAEVSPVIQDRRNPEPPEIFENYRGAMEREAREREARKNEPPQPRPVHSFIPIYGKCKRRARSPSLLEDMYAEGFTSDQPTIANDSDNDVIIEEAPPKKKPKVDVIDLEPAEKGAKSEKRSTGGVLVKNPFFKASTNSATSSKPVATIRRVITGVKKEVPKFGKREGKDKNIPLAEMESDDDDELRVSSTIQTNSKSSYFVKGKDQDVLMKAISSVGDEERSQEQVFADLPPGQNFSRGISKLPLQEEAVDVTGRFKKVLKTIRNHKGERPPGVDDDDDDDIQIIS